MAPAHVPSKKPAASAGVKEALFDVPKTSDRFSPADLLSGPGRGDLASGPHSEAVFLCDFLGHSAGRDFRSRQRMAAAEGEKSECFGGAGARGGHSHADSSGRADSYPARRAIAGPLSIHESERRFVDAEPYRLPSVRRQPSPAGAFSAGSRDDYRKIHRTAENLRRISGQKSFGLYAEHGGFPDRVCRGALLPVLFFPGRGRAVQDHFPLPAGG